MAKRRRKKSRARRRRKNVGSFAFLVNPGKKRRRRRRRKGAPKMARRRKHRRKHRKHNPFGFLGNPRRRRRRKSRRHNPRRRHHRRRRNPGSIGGMAKGFLGQLTGASAKGGALGAVFNVFAGDPLLSSQGFIGSRIPPIARGLATIGLHVGALSIAPKVPIVGKLVASPEVRKGWLAYAVGRGVEKTLNRVFDKPAAALEDMADSYGVLLDQSGIAGALGDGGGQVPDGYGTMYDMADANGM